MGVLKAWETGGKAIRNLIVLASILGVIAICIAILGNILYPEETFPKENNIVILLTGGTGFIAFVLYSICIAYAEIKEQEKNEEIINKKEKEVSDHPNEPKLAWDLARIKLENYLNRNLSQVRAIFYLSVSVMLIGFGLIIYGTIKVYDSPDNFKPSIVVALAGVIINFIGASFLILYKSTMEQAKEYVIVLERINAVGMSVQVIDTIVNSEIKLKDKTKAELAKKLIEIYSKK